MPRRYSDDLRVRVPILFNQYNMKVKQICEYLGVKKTFVYKELAQCHLGIETPCHYRRNRRGRPRILSTVDEQYITSLLKLKPTLYLDEIQDALFRYRHVSISIPALYRALWRLDITRKVVSAKALERNEVLRSHFMLQIARIAPNPDMLVFIDESARNRRTSQRKYGRSFRGQRCVQRRYFVRGQRVSILPALTLDGFIGYDIIPGSITAEKFLSFLRRHVIPYATPYPGPRSVIIVDNCNIHHNEAVRQLIEDDALCKLVYLPPYSPDFNPIEQAFSSIKAFLRRHWQDFSWGILDRACMSITPLKAWGYFRDAGYV
ncbi:hypothetical protein D9757_001550 [Collybiopsis confluens]|uniref:Tc1-like transposase DDE domain-containing protein n=1 Tax=Collybiopsis confluens TaxID=2823264 RepID=A0A8H5HZM4_9AGAR|nr:hypothetical protein D9757_001550 [Collybiopsis confluens]